MTEGSIDRLSRKYWRNSLWLVAAITLITLIVIQVFNLGYLVLPLVISSVFSLVTAFGYSLAWRLVALKSPDSLTFFYSAGSGFRFLFALVTMFVYYLIGGRTAMLPFVIVFMITYLVMLVYHTVYFSKATASSGKLKVEAQPDK